MGIAGAGHIPVASAVRCGALCTILFPTCKAFTFVGNHCYLKHGWTGRGRMPVATSGTCGPSSADEAGCSVDPGYNYAGHDIPAGQHIAVESVAACRNMCSAHTSCAAYTYAWGHCYLKSSAEGREPVAQAISGSCKMPTAVPTQSPSTPPTPEPTDVSSSTPSATPTKPPLPAPTTGPTISTPSATPSKPLSPAPTTGPTIVPSAMPSVAPSTSQPTPVPTALPTTSEPTWGPTTTRPTRSPTTLPTTTEPTTLNPTPSPTTEPTSAPTHGPTQSRGCTREAGIEYYGADMPSGRHPDVETPEECAQVCLDEPACPAFTFVYDTCYLKMNTSGRQEVLYKSWSGECMTRFPTPTPTTQPTSPTRAPTTSVPTTGVPTTVPTTSEPTPAVPTPAPTTGAPTTSPTMLPTQPKVCVYMPTTTIFGGDIPTVNGAVRRTEDQYACADLCLSNPECEFFSFYLGMHCYLKHSNTNQQLDFNGISGRCGNGITGAPTVPAPTAPPVETEWSLQYALVGFGCCRTAQNGGGQLIAKLEVNEVPASSLCKDLCRRNPQCVGIEWSAIRGCELHKQPVTWVTVNTDNCSPSTVGCWEQLPLGGTPSPHEPVMPTEFGNDVDIFVGSPTWHVELGMPVSLSEVGAGIVDNLLFVFGEGSHETMAMNINTGQWLDQSAIALRPYYGHHQSAVTLAGELYVIGGFAGSAKKLQIYNPASNTWRVGPDLPWHTAGSIPAVAINGKIYACSGLLDVKTLEMPVRINSQEGASYHPATESWLSIASMPTGVNHAAAGTDGTDMYIFGGRTNTKNRPMEGIDKLQIYSPGSDTWTYGPEMPIGRGGWGHAPYVGGHFYLMGGEGSSAIYAEVHRYDPREGTYALADPLPFAMHGMYPIKHPWENTIFIAGGGVNAGFSAVPHCHSLRWDLANPEASVVGVGSVPAVEGDGAADVTPNMIIAILATGTFVVVVVVVVGAVASRLHLQRGATSSTDGAAPVDVLPLEWDGFN